MCKVCRPFLQEGSKIINVASSSAFLPLPYLNIYAASKSFARNYSRALNVELKGTGITATAVCPGWVDTPLAPSSFNGKKMNCVVIPVDYNGITVTADKTTGLPNAAFQNCREWETSQKFKDACIANNTDKPNYFAPSHSIEVSYPEKLEEAYKKRHEELVRKDEKFMATNPTVEGEATASYISRLVKPMGIRVTRLAYGVPVGGDLEYADELTLGRSIINRQSFKP